MFRIAPLVFLLVCFSFNVAARDQAGIATAHPLATQAGEEILTAGGNAFDAAVAVTAALAVVEPYSSGIGGGGFWLLHRASDGLEIMVDGRERAPLKAHRDMYLDKQGQIIKDASINGPLSAGIPGVPAALEHLSNRYGELSLEQNLQPAIRFARQGFEVDELYRRLATFRLEALRASPAAAEIFLDNNEVPAKGYRIKQPDLARTLELMAERGASGFYQGAQARKLVAGTNADGGIWSLKDLEQYQIIEREPIRGQYRDMKITAAAPPSSGGIALVEILNQLAGFPMTKLESSQQKHFIIEAMRRAYRDRAEYLGDPDFVGVPVKLLTSKDYAAGLRAAIHPEQATDSESLPGVEKLYPGTDTTHFSIIDHQGNRVAATLSINYPFGSCFVPPGTGVLLNDEMDDFSSKPGEPNVYGLVGAEANAIEPGKRMLSSMTPTFLETSDRIAVIGTPGGSRIITMVLLGTMAFEQGQSAQDIVNLPRFHHQYLPDLTFYEEKALNQDEIAQLQLMGHQLKAEQRSWGNMQLVIKNKNNKQVDAASDSRGVGQAAIIH